MKNYKVALCCFFMLLSRSMCLIADDTDGANHVIVAFDEAGTSWRGFEGKVVESVKYYLFDNDGAPLLGKEDYYSVVGFKADCSGMCWNDFVYIKNSPYDGKKLSFVKSDSEVVNLTDDRTMWYRLAAYQGGIYDAFSLVSIAKPYILSVLGKVENKPLVKKTYILLITDHRYNGNDFYNELQYYVEMSGLERQGFDIHKVLNVCYAVEEEFCIRYVSAIEWQPLGFGAYHNVELYEVSANYEFLTLPAVIDYAPSLKAKRIRGRKYSVDLELVHSNHHFSVNRLQADLCTSSSERRSILELSSLDSLKMDVVFARKEKVNYIELSADLVLNDGVYNAALLTPDMIKGLKQRITIIKEENARFLFGLIPLPDFLWLPWIESQYVAAIVLDFLILAIIIVSFVIYLKATDSYKPEKTDVHIRFYE